MKLFLSILCGVALGVGTGWAAETGTESAPNPDPVQVVSADEREMLMGLEGQVVRVEGTLVRVGSTADAGITFLNMSKVPDGFVGIVLKKDLAMFPDGFEAYLNRPITISGTLKVYQEKVPQIVVESPAQITLTEAVAPAAE